MGVSFFFFETVWRISASFETDRVEAEILEVGVVV